MMKNCESALCNEKIQVVQCSEALFSFLDLYFTKKRIYSLQVHIYITKTVCAVMPAVKIYE